MIPDISQVRHETRGFWLYWLSTTMSYLGDGARFVAIPLLAATLTSSPARVGLVAVMADFPGLSLGCRLESSSTE